LLQIQNQNLKLEQETQRTKQETAKLEQEVAALKQQNAAWWMPILMAVPAVFGALCATLPIVWGFWEKSRVDRRLVRTQRAKERAERREKHAFHLLENLISPISTQRNYAAAGLITMIKEDLQPRVEVSPKDSRDVRKEREEEAADQSERRDAIAMIGTLFGQLRGDEPDQAKLRKFIADELCKIVVDQKKLGTPITLKTFYLQQINAENAFLKEIDGSGVDFFDSRLDRASFRDAVLRETVFFEAKLSRSVFANADLNGANFTGADVSGADFRGAHLENAMMAGALNLETAKFDAATTWNEKTTWPSGFDPVARGLAPQATAIEPTKASLFTRPFSRRAS
jgi:hypothetical protein